jgi:hypothetical protein
VCVLDALVPDVLVLDVVVLDARVLTLLVLPFSSSFYVYVSVSHCPCLELR